MDRARAFRREHPSLFFLDLSEPERLAAYLEGRGWLAAASQLERIEKAGEGNMNLVVRAITSAGSLVVKQSRPWVEKYDEIDAPWDRARVEAAFYAAVAAAPEATSAMPALIGVDHESRILVMEDLGPSRDYAWIYGGGELDSGVLDTLVDWLVALHRIPTGDLDPEVLGNRDMRRLNHEHMFALPLRDPNGLVLDDICAGLAAVSRSLVRDSAYVARVRALGERYLADPPGPAAVLLHGDFYPGSWLDTDHGTRVIDPEFCFLGPAEIDIGVAIAHLALSRQPSTLTTRLLERYGTPPGFDEPTALAFAGVEIMRRLIGVAQLPVSYGIDERAALLDRSRALVLEGNREALE